MGENDDIKGFRFENLEKWKQFENMEFSRKFEREKLKPQKRTPEDEEIDNCSFDFLNQVLQMKDLSTLNTAETKNDISIALKLNERHYKEMKEREKEYCTFFMKTGACRYGIQCKRFHIVPLISKTLIVEQMYKDSYNKMKNITKGLDDSLLELDEEELQKSYEAFYDDVFGEWEKFGKIIQFKVTIQNLLIDKVLGNIYIQYEDIESAIIAKVKMDGRYYGGYPLKVDFSLIRDWKQAICAYNGTGMSSCPKFSECNFLHVFRNPRDEFPSERRSPDRDKKYKRDEIRGYQSRDELHNKADYLNYFQKGEKQVPKSYHNHHHSSHEKRRSKSRSRSGSRSRKHKNRGSDHSHKRKDHRSRSKSRSPR